MVGGAQGLTTIFRSQLCFQPNLFFDYSLYGKSYAENNTYSNIFLAALS